MLLVFVAAVAGGVLLTTRGATVGTILLTATLLAFYAFASRMARLDLGADGLLLRWQWTRRFVPWRDLEGVDYGPEDALVVRVRGEPALVLWSEGADDLARRAENVSLRARVMDAWQEHRDGASEPAPDVLARSGRPVAEWRQALRALRVGGGGYRAGTVPDEDLWRIVEDARATEEARAAAAIALCETEAAARRIRVAADAVASPRLRVALEKADAAPEVLDEALAKLAAKS